MKFLLPLVVSTFALASCSSIVQDDVSRYRIVNDSVSWTEAKLLAEQEGGHLATFSSWQELNHLESRLPVRSIFWIGLTDEVEEGAWTWVDGTPLERGMQSNLQLGRDRATRDYAHITLQGEFGSRDNSGALPQGVTGRNQVDGYVIEFD